MTHSEESAPIDQQAVVLFFSQAWTDLDWDGMPSIMGEQTADGLLPPAFQYSEVRSEATQVAADIIARRRTSFTTAEKDFTSAGMALPAIGDLSIICDGEGQPAALLEDYRIEVENGQVIEHFHCRYPTSD